MTAPCKRCDELGDTLAMLIESSNQLQRRYLVALDALHEAEKDAQHWKAVVGQRKEAKWADSTRAISLLVEWMLMDGGHEVEVSRVGKYFTARLTAHDGAVTKFLGHGESLIGAIFDCHERSKQ